MNTEKVIVEDNRGIKTEALMVTCPECNGNSFSLFVIHQHNHLTCNTCKTTFCQGGGQCGDVFCEEPKQPEPIPNCPNCNGERELNGKGGYMCHFCGMEEGG